MGGKSTQRNRTQAHTHTQTHMLQYGSISLQRPRVAPSLTLQRALDDVSGIGQQPEQDAAERSCGHAR